MSQGKTIMIPGLIVNANSVDMDLQMFVNDIIYRLFYRNTSSIPSVFKQNGNIDPNTVVSLLTRDFSEYAPQILPYYPKVKAADITVDSVYALNKVINVSWTISVQPTSGNLIYISSSASFPE